MKIQENMTPLDKHNNSVVTDLKDMKIVWKWVKSNDFKENSEIQKNIVNSMKSERQI
jgi:hypothetical protein